MNKKKLLKLATSLVLVAVIAVGVTFAYLTAVTDTKENKFTSTKGITGEITEKDWTHGDEGWKDYLPGQSTGKNPVVKIDTDVSAYVGMKVECVDANGETISFSDFTKDYATVSYLETNGINPDWTKATTTTGDFYVYKEAVANGSTTPLFDTVTVNLGIVKVYTVETETLTSITVTTTDEDGKVTTTIKPVENGEKVIVAENQVITDQDGNVLTQDATLPSFQINVTGYAVQAEGFTQAEATTELIKLAGLN